MSDRRIRTLAACAALVMLGSCESSDRLSVPGREGASKSAALVRAERRAYDGAPPTIGHENFGIECSSCHSKEGMSVEGVGFAPPMPHEQTDGMSAISRCRQCHVFVQTDALFVSSNFSGLRQDLRRGSRLSDASPPVMPHSKFMRENCLACHSGPAAREEIRTSHPERARCSQCHVSVQSRSTFLSQLAQ